MKQRHIQTAKHSYHCNIIDEDQLNYATRFILVTFEICNMLSSKSSIRKIDPQNAFFFLVILGSYM